MCNPFLLILCLCVLCEKGWGASGGCEVGIVRSQTQATEFYICVCDISLLYLDVFFFLSIFMTLLYQLYSHMHVLYLICDSNILSYHYYS
jgi:hypothetical protein